MARPPFNILRAVFWLLACIIVIEMFATIAGGTMCWLINFYELKQPGACLETGNVIREIWNEMITAALALLLAGRNMGPPPPPPDKEEPDDRRGV